MIKIVIPVFNRWQFTKNCLLCLREQSYKEFQIIVVDHGSTDGTSEHIQRDFPEVVLLKGDESMWWTAATNMGVRYAIENKADFVLTLNNDLVINSDYLETIIQIAVQHPHSLIGSVSLFNNNAQQVAFAGVSWNKWTARYKSSNDLKNFQTNEIKFNSIETDLLPGRGTLIPVEAFSEVGLFDEVNFPHYAADEELSFRCKKAGYNLIISTKSRVYIEVNSIGNIEQTKNLRYWKNLLFSIRSPANLKYRWLWAVKCAPIPPLYFIFDLCRIFGSELKIRK